MGIGYGRYVYDYIYIKKSFGVLEIEIDFHHGDTLET